MKDERKDAEAEAKESVRDLVAKSFISDQELNDYAAEELERIKHIMLSKELEVEEGSSSDDPTWMPQVCFVSRKEETENNRKVGLFVFGGFPATHSQKAQLLSEAGKKAASIREMQCVAAFFSSEVWFRIPPPGALDLSKAPSECDDRREGLIINGCTIDGRNAMLMRGIVREGGRKDGRIIDLVDVGMDVPYAPGDKAKSVEAPLMLAFFKGYLRERVMTGPFKGAFNEDGSEKDDEAPPTGRWKQSGRDGRVTGWTPPTSD